MRLSREVLTPRHLAPLVVRRPIAAASPLLDAICIAVILGCCCVLVAVCLGGGA